MCAMSTRIAIISFIFFINEVSAFATDTAFKFFMCFIYATSDNELTKNKISYVKMCFYGYPQCVCT